MATNRGTSRRGGTTARASTRSGGRAAYVLVGAALLVVAIVIAVLTVGETASGPDLEELAGSPRIEGDQLPPAPADPADDPAAGATAPVVSGAGFDGEPATIGEAGRPQLITFMAAWCPHCQDELPEVADWIASGEVPDGLDVTTVVTGLDDTRPNWPPDAWLDREGYTGAVLVDDAHGSVGRTYGLTGTPYWVALDADGTVQLRVTGRLGIDTVADIAALLVGDSG